MQRGETGEFWKSTALPQCKLPGVTAKRAVLAGDLGKVWISTGMGRRFDRREGVCICPSHWPASHTRPLFFSFKENSHIPYPQPKTKTKNKNRLIIMKKNWWLWRMVMKQLKATKRHKLPVIEGHLGGSVG